MTATYKIGTVATTNGNATVVGTGTAWVVAAVAGGMFSCDGLSVPIASITDDTHLTLDYPWPGTTGTGKSYSIMRENSDASDIVDMHDKLAALLVQLSIAGIHPNSAGTLAQRNALSLNASNDGYLFLQAELGVAFAFYRWDGNALAWVGPFAVGSGVVGGGVNSIVGSGITVDNTNPVIPVLSLTNDAVTNAKLANMATSLLKGKASAGTGDPEDITLSQALDMIGSAAQGDILYRGSATWQRLARGTALQQLRVNAALTALEWANDREVLTGNRTYYVGFDMGAVSIPIASPAVVTKNAHGLVAGSRVSFMIKPNRKTATVSIGSPAVVTMANTFAAGQPIVFDTTGRLPKGLVAGTTYYVISTGLSTSSFQISATVGGAAINTSNPTFTVTIASPGVVTETGHGRSTGDAIQLATTGALPTGLAAATTYFINVIDANTYNLRLTPEGANINTSGTQSGTHSIVQFGTHYLSETGVLPTGITAGQDYFVIATGLTTNAFQFSATSGGAAINATGSTSGTIVCKTGSDANNGLTQSASGSFLTVQKAIDTIAANLDVAGFTTTIQIADGTYLNPVTLKNVTGFSTAGTLIVQGNNTFPANVLESTTSASAFGATGLNVAWDVRDLKIQTTTAGNGLDAQNGSVVRYQNLDFGSCANAHLNAATGSKIIATGNYTISGGASVHYSSTYSSFLLCQGLAVTLVNMPAFSFAFATAQQNSMFAGATIAFSGFATGTRFYASGGGNVFSNSGGASYFPGNAAGTGTNFGASPYGLYL